MERCKVKAFVSWSGGKDGALSYYRAMKIFHVTHLLNMVAEDGRISRSHGIRTDILRLQAEAMGLTIVQPRSSWETYEAEFKKALSGLKGRGVEIGIFGDIDLNAHREWVERVSKESGMEAVLPLWGENNRENLIEELIEAGFETVVVATKKDLLGPEWLGRRIDHDFVRDISKIKGVDISGEGGEYHTFVVSGPIFKKRINILKSEKVSRGEHSFLNISECELQ
ncbi:MAG: diphthine--ammonia ligase [Desulfobacterales bacterium]|uniref:Diphthine--ammonia ligase n=1 Tax=Candidatus Desulfaltia bathyphila TaxID=2841697 RepID=A0A8J6N8Z3_9BACT|nr:diphthine--ammonia ligase [Candidatus Desulfaltia bathyphila]MBL7195264.1 diphthine--ammonia ligase [Desulfobacterales bacterium]MBL7207299.1 diphthine--ammonia ligase [Desulfobacterales bacterium]